jgi:hypothetical protein
MTDIIKAMNPTTPLTTEDSALAAAKVSAVGIVIGAIHQAVGTWYASTPEAAAAASAMVEELTGQTPDAAALAQQSQTGLMLGGVLIVIALILALLQWRKPNGVLPILFLVLVIWSLGAAALALVIPAWSASQPLWLTLFSLVTMAVATSMHMASIRGVSALNKIRMAAAR